MRGFVCARLGVLPNDPLFRAMSDEELVFAHYYLRKRDVEERIFWLDEGPRLIGRAIGTFWTYENAAAAAGGGGENTCTACGSQDKVISYNSSSPTLVCQQCGEPWDIRKLEAGGKPSEANFPLAMMIAIAMRSKKSGDLLEFIKKSLRPRETDPTKGTPSETVMGATMMDSKHSTPKEFEEIARAAQAEVGLSEGFGKLDEVFKKVDAHQGGVVKDRTDQEGAAGSKDKPRA